MGEEQTVYTDAHAKTTNQYFADKGNRRDLDWLRQCRRAVLYEQGRAIYENGGLNLANLIDEQQIEAEDDYRICARRGREQEDKPKKRQRKILPDDGESEEQR